MTRADDQTNLVVGVDIGGTFTDLVVVDEERGRIFIGKELTTSDDPARAVLHGISTLCARHGLRLEDLAHAIHATTLITNAIIERKGARTGLLTTAGFRDVLEIGREAKYDLYDLFLTIPASLIPRKWRAEAPERIDIDGRVVAPIDLEAVDAAVDRLVADGCEALAISFLHAYRNAAHEQAAAERIQTRHPSLYVSLSSDVAPEIREYERTNTTAANAYVRPLIDQYLGRLLEVLGDDGFTGSFSMMLSNGGLTSVPDARARPIGLLESGPAAGALVAGHFAQLTAEPRVLAFDMGGTTAKACLIEDGAPATTYLFEAAREQRFKRGSGLPIRTASVELIEIGAGGGSLARVNDLGLLKVGPESAGAMPGPACYGRGGTTPTVTDANLVLGYYDAGSFLGGEMALDLPAAQEALGDLAGKLGIELVDAAWGIHNVVNEQMASAARIHAAEKGRDVRQYTLLTTGGAAPCHGPRIAQKLQMRQVVCPPNAGVASSFGLLVAPPRVDLVRSSPMRLAELDWPAVEQLYAEMAAQALSILAEAGAAPEDVRFERTADMRYVGQGFEITVGVPAVVEGTAPADILSRAFSAAYQESFARIIPDTPIEALTWRLQALGSQTSTAIIGQQNRQERSTQAPAPRGSRPAFFPEWGEYRPTPVFDRYHLGPGFAGSGPSIIEERESTTVIPPGFHWCIDEFSMLKLTWEH
ncbi:MAG: hydantoinase/oxoprolinase family protein [Chloroflexi bacterium]|nr:hydantoinase/oxoprolinase family protein [Chloroflexota bacterium]